MIEEVVEVSGKNETDVDCDIDVDHEECAGSGVDPTCDEDCGDPIIPIETNQTQTN